MDEIGNAMYEIRHITNEEIDLAREMETRILDSSFDGILFASATPTPLLHSTQYSVVIGCSRKYEERTVATLIEEWLRKWYPQVKLMVVCRGGIIRESQKD